MDKKAGIEIPFPLPGQSYLESAWLFFGAPGTVMDAIRQAVEDDKTALIEIIRSDQELNNTDRRFLADYIEGKFARKAGGQPHATLPRDGKEREKYIVKEYGEMVVRYKEELRKHGRLYGKAAEAVELFIEYGKQQGCPYPNAASVRRYLKNRKRRSAD